jgi:hypothetical protein
VKRLALLLALGACTEQVTAPGACPDFCPGGSITVVDTIFADVIQRDSAFPGYLEAFQGEALPVADLPGIVDSRAIFLMNKMFVRVIPNADDTVTAPITVDSSWLRLNIVRRDRNTANLWIKLYRLPLDLDSTKTFGALDPPFTASSLDSANIDTLLAQSLVGDTATVRVWGDSIRTDGAGHVLQVSRVDSSLVLYFRLDTLRAPFSVPDSGQLAFGVRVSADSLASIALGANESGDRDAFIRRFYRYEKMIDSTTDSTVQAFVDRETIFDSFVFDPPTPALDSNLVVGGVPAARSLLRVAIPPALRDSADVVRATLILVPVGPVPGAAGDSFAVVARPVLSDLGAKSPLGSNPALFGHQRVHLNSTDTVRIELTNLIRTWARDTTAATAFVLGQVPEAASYTQIRFYSTRTPAFRPALHVTYVRRYAFGTP